MATSPACRPSAWRRAATSAACDRSSCPELAAVEVSNGKVCSAEYDRAARSGSSGESSRPCARSQRPPPWLLPSSSTRRSRGCACDLADGGRCRPRPAARPCAGRPRTAPAPAVAPETPPPRRVGPRRRRRAWRLSVAIFATSLEVATPIEIERPVVCQHRSRSASTVASTNPCGRPVEPRLVDRERLDDRARVRAGSPSGARSTSRYSSWRGATNRALRRHPQRHGCAHAAADAERRGRHRWRWSRSSAATCADRARRRSGADQRQAPAARSPRPRSRSDRRHNGRCSGLDRDPTRVGSIHALSNLRTSERSSGRGDADGVSGRKSCQSLRMTRYTSVTRRRAPAPVGSPSCRFRPIRAPALAHRRQRAGRPPFDRHAD